MKVKLIFLILVIAAIPMLNAQDALSIDEDGNVKITEQLYYKQIETLQDSNLTGEAIPFDLSLYNTEAHIGFRFRVCWFNGDGTNAFTFADTAVITIDGIDVNEWVGQGTGHLDFVYTGGNNFEVINAGEVWDSDAGKYSGSWFKYLSGNANATSGRATTLNTSGATIGMPIQLHYKQYESRVTINITPALSSNVVYVAWANNGTGIAYGCSVAGNIITVTAEGRWTTLYPRKS